MIICSTAELASTPRRRNPTFQINHYFPNNVCARSQYWAWGGRTAPHLRRGTPRPPRGMASTPQRPPPPQRPPGPKSLLLGRPRNRSLRHLRGPEPPTRRLQPILPRKPSRTAAGRAEERRRGRGDRSAAEEAIEHPLEVPCPSSHSDEIMFDMSRIIISRIHPIIARSLHGDLRGRSVAAAPRGGAAAAQIKSLGRLRRLVDDSPGPSIRSLLSFACVCVTC